MKLRAVLCLIVALSMLDLSASNCQADVYVVTVTYRSGETKREEYFSQSAAQSAYNLANLAKGTRLIPGDVLSVTMQTVATPGGIATSEYKQRISDSYEAAKKLEKEQSTALEKNLDAIFQNATTKTQQLADTKATSEIVTALGRSRVDALALSQPGQQRQQALGDMKQFDVDKLAEETIREDSFYYEIEKALSSSGFYRPQVISIREKFANAASKRSQNSELVSDLLTNGHPTRRPEVGDSGSTGSSSSPNSSDDPDVFDNLRWVVGIALGGGGEGLSWREFLPNGKYKAGYDSETKSEGTWVRISPTVIEVTIQDLPTVFDQNPKARMSRFKFENGVLYGQGKFQNSDEWGDWGRTQYDSGKTPRSAGWAERIR